MKIFTFWEVRQQGYANIRHVSTFISMRREINFCVNRICSDSKKHRLFFTIIEILYWFFFFKKMQSLSCQSSYANYEKCFSYWLIFFFHHPSFASMKLYSDHLFVMLVNNCCCMIWWIIRLLFHLISPHSYFYMYH